MSTPNQLPQPNLEESMAAMPGQEALFPDPREEAAAAEAAAREAEGYLTNEQQDHYRAIVAAESGSDLPDTLDTEQRRAAQGFRVGGKAAAAKLSALKDEASLRLELNDRLLDRDDMRRAADREREAYRPMAEEKARVGLLAHNAHLRDNNYGSKTVEERVQARLAQSPDLKPGARAMLESGLRDRYEREDKELVAAANRAGFQAASEREAHINENGGIGKLSEINARDAEAAAQAEREAAEAARLEAIRPWQEHLGVGKSTGNTASPNSVRMPEPENFTRPNAVSGHDWVRMNAREKRAAMAEAGPVGLMTDDEIRNLDPEAMAALSDDDRDKYFVRLHRIKGIDHIVRPEPARGDVHGAASGRRRAGQREGVGVVLTPGAPRPERTGAGDDDDDLDVPPFMRGGSDPDPVYFRPPSAPRGVTDPDELVWRPLPPRPPRRTGEPEHHQMPDEALLGALGDYRSHEAERAQEPGRLRRWLGRAARRGANENETAEPEIREVSLPGLDQDDFDSNPYARGTAAHAGRTAAPAMPEVQVLPARPEPRASRAAYWWSGVPRGNSWDAEMGGPEGRASVLRGTPGAVKGAGAWALRKVGLIGAPEGAGEAPAEPVVPAAPASAPEAARGRGGRRRPEPARRPAPVGRDVNLDELLDRGDEPF